MKKTNLNNPILLVILGLGILSVLLSACQNDPGQSGAAIGLRTDTVAIETQTGGDIESANSTDPTGETTTESTVDEQAGLDTALTTATEDVPSFENAPVHIIEPASTAELSTSEIEALIYMREEEKLARDVYQALYDLWGLPVFQNIAGSEQNHMDSVFSIIDAYGLTDPVGNNGAGEFTNPELGTLYDQLLAEGSLSPADALRVGAAIEELDIVDLNDRLAQVENQYVVQIFSNLRAGSENHLRAFVTNLEKQTGEKYTPVYLDESAFLTIMSDTGNGGPGQGRNAGNGGRNGQGGNGNGQGGNGQGGNGNGQGGNGRQNG